MPLQLLQFLPEGRQARDGGAVGLVGDRLFLHLRPSRVGFLFIPGTPGFWIKRSLRDEIVQRASIIVQIEDAIAVTSSGDQPIINSSMNMGDAMLLGRGRCLEGVAEHDCGGKRNFYLARHFLSPGRTSRLWPVVAANTGRDRKCRRHHKALYEGHLSGSAEHILSSSELGTKAREPF